MKFKKFILAIFFMATSENLVSSSSSTELDTVLDYIGVKKLHEQGITGKGVKACIFDDYSKSFENADPYHTHGQLVGEYYERTAPESSTICLDRNTGPIYNTTKKVIHSLEDIQTNGGLLTFFKDHNIRIMNQSISFIGDSLYDMRRKNTFELDTLSSDYSYKDNPLGYYSQHQFLHWMDSVIKLTELGVVIIYSAGNKEESLGMSPEANAFHFLNEVINENPKNPGAFLFAGSSQLNLSLPYPKLASYSNTASIFRDAYLHVPTSLTYLEKLPVSPQRKNISSFIMNNIFKVIYLPTLYSFSLHPLTSVIGLGTAYAADHYRNLLMSKEEFLDKKDRLPKAWTGTSLAAPTLSGMVALLMEAFPKATGKQIANLLLSAAQLPDSENPYTYGQGMPNVHTAYLKGLELNINDDRDVLRSLYPPLSLGDLTIDPEAFNKALAELSLFYKITSLEKKD